MPVLGTVVTLVASSVWVVEGCNYAAVACFSHGGIDVSSVVGPSGMIAIPRDL